MIRESPAEDRQRSKACSIKRKIKKLTTTSQILASSRRLILVWCLFVGLAMFMISIRTTFRDDETHAAQARSKPDQGCTCNMTLLRERHEHTTYGTDQLCTTYSRFELNRRYQVNISTIEIQAIEDIVFGDARASAEAYVEDVSAALMTSGSEKLTPYYKNHTAFVEADNKNILLGNYTYHAGGRWKPINCEPKWKVAIVIPYRDRIGHLAILIRNLLQVLTLQNLEFGIFVAEQANDLVFNRGLMKNIGYMESTNFGAWDCVIFHDIDQVPMRATNSYGCEDMPKHMCAYAEEMGFKLMYGALFGGVVGVSAEQMKKSNGYSNVYWGWGGEDDDIRSRLNKMDYKIHRSSGEGYYKTLKHKKKTAGEICDERHCLLKRFAERMAWDGISHTRYNANVTLNLLFTHIAVDARKEEWNTYECKK